MFRQSWAETRVKENEGVRVWETTRCHSSTHVCRGQMLLRCTRVKRTDAQNRLYTNGTYASAQDSLVVDNNSHTTNARMLVEGFLNCVPWRTDTTKMQKLDRSVGYSKAEFSGDRSVWHIHVRPAQIRRATFASVQMTAIVVILLDNEFIANQYQGLLANIVRRQCERLKTTSNRAVMNRPVKGGHRTP